MAVESRREIGGRIRERRRDLGLTQQELGETSGTSESSVKRLEWGQRIDRTKEKDIARALGWIDGSIDLLHAGKEPILRSEEAAAERAWGESFVDDVRAMSYEEMARRAAFVAAVTEDPAEGDKIMEAMLRIRRAANQEDPGQDAVGS
ncbi:helix-turn-helix transcriptional regulator [Amycolatopsis sp. WAC 04182]|uniref:helix-turn-helix domain-containing protein n=1 Tax=Amycolatopsis sp. WAC 04182 TaxID=2203198 RepID=UPI001315343C|nr:helix-turn-helix transcriptional regulator [Amycolatopsis sp. WAC 04182]